MLVQHDLHNLPSAVNFLNASLRRHPSATDAQMAITPEAAPPALTFHAATVSTVLPAVDAEVSPSTRTRTLTETIKTARTDIAAAVMVCARKGSSPETSTHHLRKHLLRNLLDHFQPSSRSSRMEQIPVIFVSDHYLSRERPSQLSTTVDNLRTLGVCV